MLKALKIITETSLSTSYKLKNLWYFTEPWDPQTGSHFYFKASYGRRRIKNKLRGDDLFAVITQF